MKRSLRIAPVAACVVASGLALGACTTDELNDFAYGLNTFAYELDNQLNPPCPGGMYRAFVPDTLPTSYPQYPYQQVGYTLTPGGYSYCAFPVSTPSYDDRHHDHGRRDGRRD